MQYLLTKTTKEQRLQWCRENVKIEEGTPIWNALVVPCIESEEEFIEFQKEMIEEEKYERRNMD